LGIVDIFNGHLKYLWTFGIFYDHSVHFVFIWYIFSSFGLIHQEKSGNPADLFDNPNPTTSEFIAMYNASVVVG
jgi:hypothetical protein